MTPDSLPEVFSSPPASLFVSRKQNPFAGKFLLFAGPAAAETVAPTYWKLPGTLMCVAGGGGKSQDAST